MVNNLEKYKNGKSIPTHVGANVNLTVRQKIDILVSIGKFKSIASFVRESVKLYLRQFNGDIMKGQRLITEAFK